MTSVDSNSDGTEIQYDIDHFVESDVKDPKIRSERLQVIGIMYFNVAYS